MMARARTYQEPTLFGAVYASRLLDEMDIGDPNCAADEVKPVGLPPRVVRLTL
jgi:hypothetical protein